FSIFIHSSSSLLFLPLTPPLPISTLFPYTTLFRSRQREGRKLCISDFFEPVGSGRVDLIGFSIVTVGNRASEETKRLFEKGDYTDRKSTRLNSSHLGISYAVFCLKKKKK